jgi:hypothetical protein
MRFYAPRKQSGDARRTDVRVEFRLRPSSLGAAHGAMNERKTLESPHLRPTPRVHPVKPNRTLDADPILQAPPQCFHRPPTGSCADAFLCAAFRYPCGLSRPGRCDWSFPLSPGGARGVQPFAGSFPPTVDRSFLSRRTHLPFHRIVRPD